MNIKEFENLSQRPLTSLREFITLFKETLEVEIDCSKFLILTEDFITNHYNLSIVNKKGSFTIYVNEYPMTRIIESSIFYQSNEALKDSEIFDDSNQIEDSYELIIDMVEAIKSIVYGNK